jgi:hypothetical protein
MKKSIIYKIILLAFIALVFYSFSNFRRISNDVKYLESSSFSKYLELFMITENRIPRGVNEILNFIKERNLELYEGVKDIELEYIKHDKNSFNVYHKGFDGVDDLFKNNYSTGDKIDFINSFFKKGDIELNLFFKFNQKSNTFYKVGENNLIEEGKFVLSKIYMEYFNCDKIREKSLDYNQINDVQLRIHNNEIEVFENSLSEETLKIYLDEIKKTKLFYDKDVLFILHIRSSNINIYECDD